MRDHKTKNGVARDCALFCGGVSVALSLTCAVLLLKPQFSGFGTRNGGHLLEPFEALVSNPNRTETELVNVTSTFVPRLPSQSRETVGVNKWSNPLWKEECANALLVKDGIDIEDAIRSHVPAIVTKWFNDKKKKNTATTLTLEQSIEASIARLIHETRHNHLVWGRERLDALFNDTGFAETFDMPSNVKMLYNVSAAKWQVIGKPKASGRLVFFKNLKSMSTSIANMMSKGKAVVTVPRSRSFGFSTKMSDFFGDDSMAEIKINKRNGVGFDYDCGFTFVRHPINKFLSGYGEVEFLRLDEKKGLQFTAVDVNKFKGLANASVDLVKRIELRFVTFVKELLKGGGNFIRKGKYSGVHHVATASGHRMAVQSAWRQDFIGKVEQSASDWQYLTHSIPQCAAGFNHAVIDSDAFEMKHERHRGDWQLAKDIWRRVLQNNRTMFDALVDYYYQDFICYDYSMSYFDWLNS